MKHLAQLAALLPLALGSSGCGEAQVAGSDLTPAERELAQRVERELNDERALNGVDLVVRGTTVLLSGQVASDRDREDAVTLVRAVPGVSDVEDHLTVSGAVATDVTSPDVDTVPDTRD